MHLWSLVERTATAALPGSRPPPPPLSLLLPPSLWLLADVDRPVLVLGLHVFDVAGQGDGYLHELLRVMKWRARSSPYWALWLFVGFLAYELFRILTGAPEHTLSWTVWSYMDTHWLAEWSVYGLLAWLAWHFVIDFRRWRRRKTSARQSPRG